MSRPALRGDRWSAATPIPRPRYTARLLSKGAQKVAQKVGEEAVETVIEGVRGRKKATLTEESADLLYHLLVLWAARGRRAAARSGARWRRAGQGASRAWPRRPLKDCKNR